MFNRLSLLNLSTSEIRNIKIATAEKALEYIININYEDLLQVLADDPTVMFVKVKKEIKGTAIETTPLRYAFYLLDKFVWDLCYDICEKNFREHPGYMEQFLQQAQEVKKYINLQPLFDAYEVYIRTFSQYETRDNGIDMDKFYMQETEMKDFIRTWLDVGKAQRDILPLHILKDMCLLSIPMQTGSHDLVLIYVNDTVDLNIISKYYHHSPVLAKLQTGGYQFYKFNFMQKKWDSHNLTDLPYNFNFPQILKVPIVNLKDSNTIDKEQYISGSYWPWHKMKEIVKDDYAMQEIVDDHGTMLQNIVFQYNNQFESLLDFLSDSKLGEEFTLARGSANACFAISIPTGWSGLLKYKAKEDMESFQALYQKRISQRNDFIAAAIKKYNFNCGLTIK